MTFRHLRWLPILLLAAAGVAPAVEDGFAPTRGTSGTRVTLTGHGFLPARPPRVDFLVSPADQVGLADARARVLSFSESAILVETPRIRPGTYAVRVTPRGGEGPPVNIPGTYRAEYPSTTSVEADSIEPGTIFTVRGTFGERKGTLFVGPKKAKVNSWADAAIVAVVPRRLPEGAQPVSVRNAVGTSAGDVVLEVAVDPPPPPAVPALTISRFPLEIQIPQNCPQVFEISNTGDPGSILDFTIADDGALGGFLQFSDPLASQITGTVAAGSSISIAVRVRPDFVASEPTLAGADVGLTVYTPGASNYTEFPILVKIRSAAQVAQRLVGTWSGTWSGDAIGPNNPMQAKPRSPVSGTWSLVIGTVDLDLGTISGSLTWNGSDAYWTYSLDGNFNYVNVTPVLFVPDRTIAFTGTKGSVAATGTTDTQCHRFRIQVRGSLGAANPSDAFYGPDIYVDLDTETGEAVTSGSVFHTAPYNPANSETWGSQGTLAGGKE